jgi:Cation efflux system protein CusB domain 1
LATDDEIAKPAGLPDHKADAVTLADNYSGHGIEIEEIISNRPPHIVRWGTVYFSLVLLLILFICWCIQYPDGLAIKARLTAIPGSTAAGIKTPGHISNADSGTAGAVYWATAYISQADVKKISAGQAVRLTFPSHPSAKYGNVTGTVIFVSPIATDSGYITRIGLPVKLITDYNKEIQVSEGLQAEGKIITGDVRLLDKIWDNIIKQGER